MAVNYVRFLRGTPTAYQNLRIKDPDTLYFISEPGAASGLLYLGDKLISGGGTGGGDITVFSTLSSLNDTVIKAAQTGDFLVYEEVDGEGVWVNKKAADVSKLILGQLTGATETTDGTSGVVPAPKAGDQGKFLRGDGTWAAIPGIEDIATLKTTVSTLIGDDFGKSVRAIALDTLTKALIPEGAKESLDTLQEIADWIQNHPSSPAEFNSEIKRLQEAVFDTTNAETGEVIPGLQTKVANFSTILNTLQVSVGDHETRIESIEETIKWHDMNETDGSEVN